MTQQHRPLRTIAEMVAAASPTVDFPCIMRLHDEDPCKGWLLEIHTVFGLMDGHPLEDDDAALRNADACIARFVETGRRHLGEPTKVADMRVRLMGNSGEWAMYEFTGMGPDDLDAAIARFTAAYGVAPQR